MKTLMDTLDSPTPTALPESCKLLREIWLLTSSRAMAHAANGRATAAAEANAIADICESMLTKEVIASKKAEQPHNRTARMKLLAEHLDMVAGSDADILEEARKRLVFYQGRKNAKNPPKH